MGRGFPTDNRVIYYNRIPVLLDIGRGFPTDNRVIY